jgi:HlyD family secretion protein/adhesin transport system membrane fusion protein
MHIKTLLTAKVLAIKTLLTTKAQSIRTLLTVNPQAKAESRTRLSKFLAQPLRLEEHGPPRTLVQLLVVSCLFVAGFIAWTVVTEIHESAVASGQIKTYEQVTTVQHLEGGIISEILVREGDQVVAGQPLVRLAGQGALSDLGALRVREVALSLEAERLSAFVEKREADFSIGKDYPHMVTDQASILAAQRDARKRKGQVLQSQILQRGQDVETLRGRLKNLERRLKLHEEAVGIRRKLIAKGLVSRLVYLESEQAYARAQGEILALKGDIKLGQEALKEARTNLEEFEASAYNTAITDMGRIRNELAQVSEGIKKTIDRAKRLVVAAPAAGTVKGLIDRGKGSVIRPTDVLLEIVPQKSKLVAEVKVSPKDIGYVRVGQDAKVKITTYHVARFGSVPGKVTRLSATTFRDERGEPYYKATIALERASVGSSPDRHPILPGMVVDADVITGSKTLSTYLLLPIYRSIEGSFGER